MNLLAYTVRPGSPVLHPLTAAMPTPLIPYLVQQHLDNRQRGASILSYAGDATPPLSARSLSSSRMLFLISLEKADVFVFLSSRLISSLASRPQDTIAGVPRTLTTNLYTLCFFSFSFPSSAIILFFFLPFLSFFQYRQNTRICEDIPAAHIGGDQRGKRKDDAQSPPPRVISLQPAHCDVHAPTSANALERPEGEDDDEQRPCSTADNGSRQRLGPTWSSNVVVLSI